MKEFEVDVSYEADVTFKTTIKVKAKNQDEAEKIVLNNMFGGKKDFINTAKWDEEMDEGHDPIVDQVREV